eukprot:121070_1
MANNQTEVTGNNDNLEDDITDILNWDAGSECLVYCDTQNQFILGVIQEIYTDKNGEWLKIKYENKIKSLERYSKFIKPFDNDQERKEDNDDILIMIKKKK